LGQHVGAQPFQPELAIGEAWRPFIEKGGALAV
jgi:hypothetical protein